MTPRRSSVAGSAFVAFLVLCSSSSWYAQAAFVNAPTSRTVRPTSSTAFLIPGHDRSCRSATSHKTVVPVAPLNLFGGMFGSDSSKKEDGELAQFPNLASSDLKYDSLQDYIQQWAKLFEADSKGMGLTTPVKVLPSSVDPEKEGVAAVTGVRIVFQNRNTGYKSKDEEKAMGNENGDTKKKPKKEKLEGGVEVLVEKTTNDEVQIRARRCDMDEDTMVKEMSEESIINELRKAVDVWKKEQK